MLPSLPFSIQLLHVLFSCTTLIGSRFFLPRPSDVPADPRPLSRRPYEEHMSSNLPPSILSTKASVPLLADRLVDHYSHPHRPVNPRVFTDQHH